MFTARPAVRRRALVAPGTAVTLALVLAACGSSGGPSSMPGMDHGATASTSPAASGSPSKDSPSKGHMPGMDHMAVGDGLASTEDGYRLSSPDATLPVGEGTAYRFTVTGPDAKPVTAFALDQTKRMHFYAIRTDLTGFQHLHPTMAADGTWTADLSALAPGSWRMFASFTPDGGAGKGTAYVLSRAVTVPGIEKRTPVPAADARARVDGYTVTVQGEPMAGMSHPLTVTVTKDGRPVTTLQPYLDTYAHLTAFHEGDTAFAHLHPTTRVDGDHGGPKLAFDADLPTVGNWRLFLQFRAGGELHTAALTLQVG